MRERRKLGPRRIAGFRTVKIVVIGLSVTSSWGNGHATTYRSLLSGLAQSGQEVVLF